MKNKKKKKKKKKKEKCTKRTQTVVLKCLGAMLILVCCWSAV
jgi:hypothetical protein